MVGVKIHSRSNKQLIKTELKLMPSKIKNIKYLFSAFMK